MFTKILCLVLCVAICGSLPLSLTATALNVSTGETMEGPAYTVAQSNTITGFTATRATYYLKITSGSYTTIIPVELYHST